MKGSFFRQPIKKFPTIIYFTLLLIWMGVISYFSSSDDVSSAQKSSEITHFVLHALTRMGLINACDITPVAFDRVHGFIREIAHAVEFGILGALAYLFFSQLSNHPAIIRGFIPLMFCIAFAGIDEFHQKFIPGRVSSITDVLVDALGSAAAIGFVWFILRGRHKGISSGP